MSFHQGNIPGIEHIVKRDYLQVEGSVYSLPHDTEERLRLVKQNNFLLRAFDNKVLHAPVELKDGDRVLDAGTGTGIWLQDLASQTSTKPQYLGTDIESNFFPAASTLPEDMRFEIQSTLDLPKEWTNQFTVVHQRLLIAGFRRHEWAQAISEMYRILKPGGWIQLFEVEKWTSGPALAKHTDLHYKWSDHIGILYRDITMQIPNFLRQSGFVDIHQDTRGTPMGVWAGQDGIDGKEICWGVLKGLKTPILRGGGYGVVKNEAEYDELLEEIGMEMDGTPGSTNSWTMFWAQKPLEESASERGS